MDLRRKIVDFIYEKRAIRDPFKLPKKIRKRREEIRRWVREEVIPRAIELDQRRHDEFDWEIARKGAQVGLFTDIIPKRFGGNGSYLDFLRYGTLHGAVIIEELARGCPGVAVIFGAHMLGLLPILLSMDMKIAKKYLPVISESAKSGNPKICAFAITEPTAGSDVEDTEGGKKAKLLTYTVKENGEYILNGRKCFISNGSVADIITVFASADRRKGIESWTCFVVEKGMKGFSVGRVENKMGQRASPAAELIFEDVKVPEDNRVGNEGEGWRLNLLTLDTSRPPVGAIASGTAYHAIEKGIEYAEKKDLLKYRDVQFFFADLLMKLEVARTIVWRACKTFPPVPSLSATAKCFSSDTSMEICSKVIDFMGEDGLLLENEVEKAFRDVKLTQIYEGTNQLQRLTFAEDYFLKKREFLW